MFKLQVTAYHQSRQLLAFSPATHWVLAVLAGMAYVEQLCTVKVVVQALAITCHR